MRLNHQMTPSHSHANHVRSGLLGYQNQLTGQQNSHHQQHSHHHHHQPNAANRANHNSSSSHHHSSSSSESLTNRQQHNQQNVMPATTARSSVPTTQTTSAGRSRTLAVMRLDKRDMSLYGLCPAADNFTVVVCELCTTVVRPHGLSLHMSRHHSRHSQQLEMQQHQRQEHQQQRRASSATMAMASMAALTMKVNDRPAAATSARVVKRMVSTDLLVNKASTKHAHIGQAGKRNVRADGVTRGNRRSGDSTVFTLRGQHWTKFFEQRSTPLRRSMSNRGELF